MEGRFRGGERLKTLKLFGKMLIEGLVTHGEQVKGKRSGGYLTPLILYWLYMG